MDDSINEKINKITDLSITESEYNESVNLKYFGKELLDKVMEDLDNWGDGYFVDYLIDYICKEFDYVDKVYEIKDEVFNEFKTDINNCKSRVDNIIRDNRRHCDYLNNDSVFESVENSVFEAIREMSDLAMDIDRYLRDKYGTGN